MQSKHPPRRNGKSGSKRRSSKPVIKNSTIQLQPQIHPTTLSQQAKLDPHSLSPDNALQLQRTIGNQATSQLLVQQRPIQKKENNTGLPDSLKSGIETLSGYSMDEVRVHYNSDKPAQLNALAYTQGQDIEVGPGQERHLPHEGWHLAQQMQGQVKPTAQVNGVSINDDQALEQEADVMGSKAIGVGRTGEPKEPGDKLKLSASPVAQLQKGLSPGDKVIIRVTFDEGDVDDFQGVILAVEEDGNKYKVSFNDGLPEQVVDEKDVKLSKNSLAPEKTLPPPTTDTKPPWEKDYLGVSATLKKDISQIVGEATKITDLSEDQLERLIALLKLNRSSTIDMLINALERDLDDLKKHNETPEQIETRKKKLDAEKATLEKEAFKSQFGVELEEANWESIEKEVMEWWEAMKESEGTLEFEAAFKANRMTARQINIGSTARGGRFQAQKLGGQPDKLTDREMYLDNSIQGIGERTKPENFKDRGTVNEKGVHDLSASLLRGDKAIYEQLKHYDEAVVLFMPLPEENDLRIFSALSKLKGMDTKVMEMMGGLLTRPIFAQASDMGTRYVDTQEGSEGEGNFRYGLTGTVIREEGDRARKINVADMASREKGALAYKEIATSSITRVNEIVMAYRQHQSELFPMFAAWDANNNDFVVLNEDLTPTEMTVTNDGKYRAG